MKNVIDFLAIYQRDILWDKSRAFLVAFTDVGQLAYLTYRVWSVFHNTKILNNFWSTAMYVLHLILLLFLFYPETLQRENL